MSHTTNFNADDRQAMLDRDFFLGYFSEVEVGMRIAYMGWANKGKTAEQEYLEGEITLVNKKNDAVTGIMLLNDGTQTDFSLSGTHTMYYHCPENV